MTQPFNEIFQTYLKITKFHEFVKVAQINYVSRNQLYSTANLNFDLMCKKGKTLLEAVNKLFVFVPADPKQNIDAEWAQHFKFLYTKLYCEVIP